MVQTGARRDDDDLGPATDRTGRVEGRAVTASSRGVRGRPSTSEILSTPVPLRLGIYYDPGAQGSSTQPPPIPFKTRPPTTSHYLYTPYLMTIIDILSHHLHHMIHIPEKSCPPTNPTQRKNAKNDGWEQTGLIDGGPQDPVLVPSYSGHIAGGILQSRSRYVSLTSWTPSDPAVEQLSDLDISNSSIGINGQDLALVAESPSNGLSTDSLFTDMSGNIVPGKLWPLVKNVRSVGGFAWGLDIPIFSYVCTNGETGSEVVGIVARGTFSSTYVYMDQCPYSTTISVHRRLHALVFPRSPRRAIVDGNSHYTTNSSGYDIS
ncbi:hypothetical protein M9H77_31569 [Catharanthus roseus]|uniref:Uncharacterized protein n=1 Tax=Catharanthus roseus TaxID=4058 RepID=A0ACC0A1R0_CATRO|nr:hypothetical protein M9H77_31569 [Catharanthus roseus]